ncbi:MAG: YdcF family protein, partial [Eubacterium sp.]|nr:YdcF family protein [Eubacterium sp.]
MEKDKKKSRKKRKKVLLGILISLALVVLVPFFCYGIVHLSQSAPVPIDKVKSLAKKDAAIVPGTSGYEGSITAKGKDRLQAAIGLYEAGLVRQIIVSGDEKEIKPMTRYLMKKGIPSESLSSDPQGVDTYDTIARVKEKFGDLSYYFCTQELYSSRAGYLMDRLGVDGAVVSVDTMYYSNAGKNAVREFFAATKAVFEPIVLFGK